ncbi:OVCA2 serine hydrolase domain containing [Paragonimus heterotremus]|uniref:OVCA2 serine hydrolase domain containing n=1 Tax=Paragonimus heterotremus TaxID=100268 RepID=A0A8J4WD21_9TREM|nr:OVCA2 serine hydrolase domain containing [Paragonimus heterotremus]
MEKLKLLCLHGYKQTGESFREKTGAFRKCMRKHCEFEFLTAPNVLTDDVGCGWWFSHPDRYFRAKDKSAYDEGFQESLDAVKMFVKTKGPFDGILAFSQGAAFALLLHLLSGQNLCDLGDFRPRFSILIAPFRSRSSNHLHLYAGTISVPTLVVYGKTDEVIPSEMTEDILPIFAPPATVYLHEGGHFIPTNSHAKHVYEQFLSNFVTK